MVLSDFSLAFLHVTVHSQSLVGIVEKRISIDVSNSACQIILSDTRSDIKSLKYCYFCYAAWLLILAIGDHSVLLGIFSQVLVFCRIFCA
jgi:hypothetical protein